jgi:peptidoglycan/xylan/chitin deacetylase (PgdA/CDA1 family)
VKRGGWWDKRLRKVVAWSGANLRRLPSTDGPRLALFCDFEGHFGGEEAARCAEPGLERLLAVLAVQNARITFNVVADLCRTHPERVTRLVEAGHEIASHGFKHEPPRGLRGAAIDRMLADARACYEAAGLNPRGFRSPESAWSMALLARLARHGFTWSAERDESPTPYWIRRDVVRVPVSTDDWDLVDGSCDVPALMDKWRDRVGAAYKGGHGVAIGVHEWVVGRYPDLGDALAAFLHDAKRQMPIVTLSAMARPPAAS